MGASCFDIGGLLPALLQRLLGSVDGVGGGTGDRPVALDQALPPRKGGGRDAAHQGPQTHSGPGLLGKVRQRLGEFRGTTHGALLTKRGDGVAART